MKKADYLNGMIDRCMKLEAGHGDGNMKTFWHNACMGFRLRKVLMESAQKTGGKANDGNQG